MFVPSTHDVALESREFYVGYVLEDVGSSVEAPKTHINFREVRLDIIESLCNPPDENPFGSVSSLQDEDSDPLTVVKLGKDLVNTMRPLCLEDWNREMLTLEESFLISRYIPGETCVQHGNNAFSLKWTLSQVGGSVLRPIYTALSNANGEFARNLGRKKAKFVEFMTQNQLTELNCRAISGCLKDELNWNAYVKYCTFKGLLQFRTRGESKWAIITPRCIDLMWKFYSNDADLAVQCGKAINAYTSNITAKVFHHEQMSYLS